MHKMATNIASISDQGWTLSVSTPAMMIVVGFIIAGCSKSIEVKNFPPQNEDICCFGDSLVYGTGAEKPEESYPNILGKIIGRKVESWGTPGDTTGQALPKCTKFKGRRFGMVIVTLGGNDIIRRVRWEETKKNLHSIFQKIQATGAVVVFTGVTGPLNPTRNKHYRKICREEGVHYIPEILDGITNDSALRADEVHPNSKGYKVMAQRIADSLIRVGLL